MLKSLSFKETAALLHLSYSNNLSAAMWSKLKNLIGLSKQQSQRALDLLQLAIEEISEALSVQQMAKEQAQKHEQAFTERLAQEEEAAKVWEEKVRVAVKQGNRAEAKRLLAKESYWKTRLDQMRKVQQQTLKTWQKLAQQEQQLQYKLDSCQAWLPLLKGKPDNEDLQQEVQEFLNQLDTDGLFQELALDDGLPPDPLDAEIAQALEGTPDTQLDVWQKKLQEEAAQKRVRAEADRLALAEKRLQQVQSQFGGSSRETAKAQNPDELLKAFMEEEEKAKPNRPQPNQKPVNLDAFFANAPATQESAEEQLNRWIKEQKAHDATKKAESPAVSKEQEEQFKRFFGD